jgi:hypothetical protein
VEEKNGRGNTLAMGHAFSAIKLEQKYSILNGRIDKQSKEG